MYISVEDRPDLAEAGTVRASSWSYQDSLCPIQRTARRRRQLDVDEGLRKGFT